MKTVFSSPLLKKKFMLDVKYLCSREVGTEQVYSPVRQIMYSKDLLGASNNLKTGSFFSVL